MSNVTISFCSFCLVCLFCHPTFAQIKKNDLLGIWHVDVKETINANRDQAESMGLKTFREDIKGFRLRIYTKKNDEALYFINHDCIGGMFWNQGKLKTLSIKNETANFEMNDGDTDSKLVFSIFKNKKFGFHVFGSQYIVNRVTPTQKSTKLSKAIRKSEWVINRDATKKNIKAVFPKAQKERLAVLEKLSNARIVIGSNKNCKIYNFTDQDLSGTFQVAGEASNGTVIFVIQSKETEAIFFSVSSDSKSAKLEIPHFPPIMFDKK